MVVQMQELSYSNRYNKENVFNRLLCTLKLKLQYLITTKQLQEPSVKLIQKLNLALNMNQEIIVQMNKSFDSEYVYNLKGKLVQIPNGDLAVRTKNNSQKINPALIRHITIK